jgi:hypothetical protein
MCVAVKTPRHGLERERWHERKLSRLSFPAPLMPLSACQDLPREAMASFTSAGYTSLMVPKSVLLSGLTFQRPTGHPSSPRPSSAPLQPRILAASTAKWDARYSHPVPHTDDYYLKCCLGGVLSCGLTHLAVTPLDVAKCNVSAALLRSRMETSHAKLHRIRLQMQVDPAKFKGLVPSIKLILAEEGAAGIWKGWLPTAIGYSLQVRRRSLLWLISDLVLHTRIV